MGCGGIHAPDRDGAEAAAHGEDGSGDAVSGGGERVAQVMRSPALSKGRRHLVVDATGVGRPVVDLLVRERLPCQLWAVTITGGDAETYTNGYYRVPKRDLIVGLQLVFQNRELQIAKGLKEGRRWRGRCRGCGCESGMGDGSNSGRGRASTTTWCWRWRWRAGRSGRGQWGKDRGGCCEETERKRDGWIR